MSNKEINTNKMESTENQVVRKEIRKTIKSLDFSTRLKDDILNPELIQLYIDKLQSLNNQIK